MLRGRRKHGYKCSTCDVYCRTRFLLQNHILEKHDKIVRYGCNFECCTYKSYRKNVMVDHIRVHLRAKKYKCLHCDFDSNNKSITLQHLELMHDDLSDIGIHNSDITAKINQYIVELTFDKIDDNGSAESENQAEFDIKTVLKNETEEEIDCELEDDLEFQHVYASKSSSMKILKFDKLIENDNVESANQSVLEVKNYSKAEEEEEEGEEEEGEEEEDADFEIEDEQEFQSIYNKPPNSNVKFLNLGFSTMVQTDSNNSEIFDNDIIKVEVEEVNENSEHNGNQYNLLMLADVAS